MTRSLLFGFLLCLFFPALADGIRITDDSGNVLLLPKPPQRIVSLTPHLTELLFAAGAGAQVVGVDSASDYPEVVRELPRVGDFSRLRFERILALKPDLIVAWVGGNRAADLHGVAQLGIPVLRTEARTLGDVPRLLRLLGKATGHPLTGVAAADRYQMQLHALKLRYATRRALPVFYQIWEHPLMSVGGGHWISEALQVCGARSVFADLDGVAPVISRESVLRRKPMLILGGSDAPALRGAWQAFTGLPAVQRGAFVQVDADRLHRATPRLLDGVAGLCEAVAAYQR